MPPGWDVEWGGFGVKATREGGFEDGDERITGMVGMV